MSCDENNRMMEEETQGLNDKPEAPVTRSRPRPRNRPSDAPSWTQRLTSRCTRRRTWLYTLAIVLVLIHLWNLRQLLAISAGVASLTLRDLCSISSMAILALTFDNPSYYCGVQIQAAEIALVDLDNKKNKNKTTVVKFHLPAFDLIPGAHEHQHVSNLTIAYQLMVTAKELHDLVFGSSEPRLGFTGAIPLRVGCLVLPFTFHLSVMDIIQNAYHPPKDVYHTTPMADDIRHVMQLILHTLALDDLHFERTDQTQSFIARANVAFEYQTRLKLVLPDLALAFVSSEDHRQVLAHARLTSFSIGNSSRSEIPTTVEILKDRVHTIERMCRHLLSGEDVQFQVTGQMSDRNTSRCFAQQVLNQMTVQVRVPGTIHGKPLVLRNHTISIDPELIDSKTQKCKIQAQVQLVMNNPLPIRLGVSTLDAQVYFFNASRRRPEAQYRLFDRLHLDQEVMWNPHSVNGLHFVATLTNFSRCMDLLRLYSHQDLAIALKGGRIEMAIADARDSDSHFAVPFSIPKIPIHWTQASVYVAQNQSSLAPIG